MFRLLAIFISLFLLTNALKAEVVNEIKISGNKRVSIETIKIYGEISINKDYSEKDLNNIIENLYSTNFFEDINVQLSNGVLKVNLVEYPVINNLIILGEPSKKYQEEITKLIKSKKKVPS